MAPVRRYLRISKYSVLECRIYLDSPSLAQSWLLNPRNPVLPRVMESIRPLVLPKLREEKERSKKKSSKKKSIKDVVVQDDFEVSIFLTETTTRHSLLAKHKQFRERGPQMMQSNSTRLMGETEAAPIELDADAAAAAILREPDSDDDVRLADVPAARSRGRPKRSRDAVADDEAASPNGAAEAEAIEVDSDADAPVLKRSRTGPGANGATSGDDDDKKKLAMDVSYEGFAIYGRVLCLVVRKRDGRGQQPARGGKAGAQGQAKMENWISSTQVPVGEELS
ncbi:hypothetical protein CDD83_6799 [Cordyceps sp. RAO-2017]|nr:hypothetical protein CDD83_6799 [Cordyceps sp. RAO-2017]